MKMSRTRKRILVVACIAGLLLVAASLPIFPPPSNGTEGAAGAMGVAEKPSPNDAAGAQGRVKDEAKPRAGGGVGGTYQCPNGQCLRCNAFGKCYCSSFC